ncbi:amine oxidase catalytic domain-containing protein [Polychaeton citri CBS 116435]|uniref:Amine oxidase n=1 Tax=Polychaeton citri CBS 116435 TaxID=1314669 RepID=A0A9P4UP29_9PEZI|nr:amine oxidase catalytic domain-containing protein [Polychaeton citri CBS 116435]
MKDSRSRLVLFASSALLFIAFATFLFSPLEFSNAPLKASAATQSENSPFTAPKQNVWAELTEDEAGEVYGFLLEEFKHLNLTKKPKTGKENYVFQVETLRPNKTDTVPYMFNDESVPGRYAKAVLNEERHGYSYLVYYSVGPLPVSEKTKVEPLEFPFNSGRNYVTNLLSDFMGSIAVGKALAENVSDITEELLGVKADPSSKNPGLEALPRPTKIEDGGVVLWIQFFRPGLQSSGRTLLPQGIYAKVNATSPDVENWEIGEWYYNGVLYKDVEQFRAAIKSPGFEKTPINLDGHWTDTEEFDNEMEGRELPPPVSVQPYGPRYKLDKKQQYVKWFGFEFYLATSPAQGLMLYDIRFKGERIMYHLGLEEAMAHYAGDDPMAGGQEFFDAFFGMGTSSFELVPGYDCPAYADYLDARSHRLYGTETLPNSICVFEYTSDYLLSRHTAQYMVTASRNTFLTLRSVATVGNYDYTIDYQFYLDGAIEVKVRASGYIYGAFYAQNSLKNEDEYGHRVHEALSTSMHDHVINFRADMDVAGSSNDMVKLAIEPTTKEYDWDKASGISERNTMHLKEYPVEEEQGIDWAKNGEQFYIVYSADKKNKWGERRGYRVTSGTGMGNTPHLTIKNSTTLGNSARWAEHDIWVVRNKDTEPRGADPLNYLEPHHPLIDFNDIANGESLERSSEYDGDLVVYFNLGSHHIPHSGDIPNTLMHTSASSVMFVPHNFADSDPSRQSVQGVRLQLHGTKAGGFPGFDASEPGNPEASEDLRARGKKDDGHAKHKMHEGANYFGATYYEGVKLQREALEPDIEGIYKSKQIRVSDLSLNGSAAGIWMKDD